MESNQVLVLVNLAVCLAGGFVCICRMGLMQGSVTRLMVRTKYRALCMGFILSGGSYWLFGWVPPWWQVGLGVVAALALLAYWPYWRHGAPHTTRMQ